MPKHVRESLAEPSPLGANIFKMSSPYTPRDKILETNEEEEMMRMTPAFNERKNRNESIKFVE